MGGDADGDPIGVDALISESCEAAQQLLDAPDAMAAYRKGMDFMSLVMGNIRAGSPSALVDIAMPLYLVWGSLTDAVDAPRANPDPTEAAETMRRAAREWLSVAPDPEARQRYLDRWLYEECGYQRPTEPT
jgi:hypothetical protein